VITLATNYLVPAPTSGAGGLGWQSTALTDRDRSIAIIAALVCQNVTDQRLLAKEISGTRRALRADRRRSAVTPRQRGGDRGSALCGPGANAAERVSRDLDGRARPAARSVLAAPGHCRTSATGRPGPGRRLS
jgi:hypothetical protein